MDTKSPEVLIRAMDRSLKGREEDQGLTSCRLHGHQRQSSRLDCLGKDRIGNRPCSFKNIKSWEYVFHYYMYVFSAVFILSSSEAKQIITNNPVTAADVHNYFTLVIHTDLDRSTSAHHLVYLYDIVISGPGVQ